jgi:hypothetical protein
MDSEGELQMAEADLAAAKRELAQAEGDVEKAEASVEAIIEEEEHRREFKVEVLYNGVKKPFEVRREEVVKTLLDKAVKAFGPIPNPHTLSLFTEAGKELDDTLTIAAVGVKPREVLLLRPSKVKGGQ